MFDRTYSELQDKQQQADRKIQKLTQERNQAIQHRIK